jgi:hypothetical protein
MCFNEFLYGKTLVFCSLFMTSATYERTQQIEGIGFIFNVEKSKFMVITNRRIGKNDIFVKIGDQQLERVEKMKYLVVILDERLKLNEHLESES